MALGFQSGAFQTPGFQQNTTTVVSGAVHVAGGWLERNPRQDALKALRDEIERERLALQISKQASAVIAKVAKTEQSEMERTQALVAALEREHIAWQQKYDAGLTAYVKAYQRVEQELLLRAEMDAEDELLLL